MNISLLRNYYYNNNEAYYINFMGIFDKYSFKVLDSLINSKIFTKIRYSLNEKKSKAYIDVYYAGSKANICHVGIDGQSRISSSIVQNNFLWRAVDFLPADTEATPLAEQEL